MVAVFRDSDTSTQRALGAAYAKPRVRGVDPSHLSHRR